MTEERDKDKKKKEEREERGEREKEMTTACTHCVIFFKNKKRPGSCKKKKKKAILYEVCIFRSAEKRCTLNSDVLRIVEKNKRDQVENEMASIADFIQDVWLTSYR